MGKNRKVEEQELNLVPIMNLVTMLIPLLLMSAQFIEYSIIDSTLPAISSEPTQAGATPPEQMLTLMVVMSEKGFTVTGADTVLDPANAAAGPLIPCTGGTCSSPDKFDYKELTRRLGRVKDVYPEHEDLVLIPAPWIPYEVIVLTMDATREDRDRRDAQSRARVLFPNVVIAASLE